MADHSPKVKQAIMAALNDINLLRALVSAEDENVNEVLTNYAPALALDSDDLIEFVRSLRHGKIECTVSDLVSYCDGLQHKVRRVDIREEWTP